MLRLTRNSKLKRLIGRLILFSFIIQCFTSTLVKAQPQGGNSNDLRAAYIALAKGKTISDALEASEMDSGSMRAIALYLSNFYVPFSTVLDNGGEESDDNDKTGFKKAMIDALQSYASFDKNAANAIAEYCIAQSLATCKEVYINESELRDLYAFMNSLSDNGMCFTNPAYANVQSCFYIKNLDNYIKRVGTKTIDGKSYVKLTYPVFLQCLACSYAISYPLFTLAEDIESGGIGLNILKGIFSSDKLFNLAFFGNYPISDKFNDSFNSTVKIDKNYPNRYLDNKREYVVNYNYNEKGIPLDANENTVNINMNEITDVMKHNGTDIPVINFVWDNNGKATPCFSSSEECMKTLAMIYSNVDLEDGIGSAFMDVESLKDLKALPKKNLLDATALNYRIYVNWVGDLILDTNIKRYVLVPGAMNPYTLTNIAGDLDAINGVNAYTLAHSGSKHIVDIGEDTTTKRHRYGLAVYDGSNSIFNLDFWRIHRTSDDCDFDQEHSFWENNWGDFEKLYEKIKKSDYIGVSAGGSDDNANFPNWGWNIIRDSTLKDISGNTIGDALNGGYKYINPIKDNSNTLGVSTNHSYITDQFLTYDDLATYEDGQSLDSFFKTGSLLEVYKKAGNLSNCVNFKDVTKFGKTVKYTADVKKFLQSLYLTYAFAYFNKDSTTFDSAVNVIDLKFNADRFPTMVEDINFAKLASESKDTSGEVLSFVYYLLHPLEGISYVATLVKNKLSGVLLGWHEDVVGSSDANSSTGMTKYLGFSGYTTMPSLYDVPFIAKMLDIYNNIIVYIIIIVCLILLCYVLVGSMRLQRGIVGVFIFSFLAFLPPVAINTTANIVNETCNSIYSTKFDYWAICQMQQYLGQLTDIKNTTDVVDYTAMLINMNYDKNSTEKSLAGDSETFYTGVKLKWMSPKKFSSTANLSNSVKSSINTDATFLLNSVLTSVENSADGQTFLDSDNALYLYRDYLDIYRYASTSYNLYTTYNFNNKININTFRPDIEAFKEGLALGNSATDSDDATMNTVSYIWKDSFYFPENSSTLTYSSGLSLRDFVLTNAEPSLTSNTKTKFNDIMDTSSLNAMRKGFLYGTLTNLDSSQCYYNKSTTLATSLFLNYANSICLNYKYLNRFNNAVQNETISLTKAGLNTDNSIKNNIDNFTYGLSGQRIIMGIQEYLGFKDADYKKAKEKFHDYGDGSRVLTIMGPNKTTSYSKLSDLYFGLYAESPFYFFNYNIQDQLKAGTYNGDLSYIYNDTDLVNSDKVDEMNNIVAMLLSKNQEYFYNLHESSGDGFGELRDFMNMHDLFYYIIPALKPGVDLANSFDSIYGMEVYDDCPLRFQSDGTFTYKHDCDLSVDNNTTYKYLSDFIKDHFDCLNEEQLYKLWHDYNVNTIFNGYTTWLATMEDCSYAKPEEIRIMDEKFTVKNPLDPTSYFELDPSSDKAKVIRGRFMVFSRSEMAYYGLKWSQLTTVEKKIITVQDNVYKKAIDLCNYYTFSDETMIQALAMLELFEFNKEFSQNSLVGEDFIMYPQSYELKAFTYDAYLRLIVAEASKEDIMSDNNDSIYKRVMSNTSLFFGIMLLINDFIAVYLIPALKMFFLIAIFFLSIIFILGSAVKMDLNIIKVTWKCLLAPLISFAGVSIGMAYIVSLFMSGGAQGVTVTDTTISMGDPTMAIIVMTIINAVVLILYWKICKKLAKDLVSFTKALATNIGGTVAGAFGTIAGVALAGKSFGRGKGGSSVASSAKQRGKDNNPKSGKNTTGGISGGAIAGGAAGATAAKASQGGGSSSSDGSSGSTGNSYDDKIEKLKAQKALNDATLNYQTDNINDKYKKAEADGKGDKADRLLEKSGRLYDKNARKNKKLDNKIAKEKDKKAFAQTKKENKEKYGRVYGTAKNIGATGTRLKNKAKGAPTALRGKLNDAAGFTGRRVDDLRRANEARQRGVASAKSGIKKAGRGVQSTVKKGSKYIKENGVRKTAGVVKDKARAQANRAGSAVKNKARNVKNSATAYAKDTAKSMKSSYDYGKNGNRLK